MCWTTPSINIFVMFLITIMFQKLPRVHILSSMTLVHRYNVVNETFNVYVKYSFGCWPCIFAMNFMIKKWHERISYVYCHIDCSIDVRYFHLHRYQSHKWLQDLTLGIHQMPVWELVSSVSHSETACKKKSESPISWI